MDIKAFIKGSVNNDKSSQRQLYEYAFGYAKKIVKAYNQNEEDAMEIINDAFLKLFSSINTYDESMPFLSWFRVIVVRSAINHYHKNKSINQTIEINDVSEQLSEEPDIQLHIKAEELLALINQLSPAYKLVLNLHALEGYTHEEISKLLGITVGTSKSNLAKARSRLQELIRKSILLIFL